MKQLAKGADLNQLTLTLIRGLPGSGKSTLAAQMASKHLEADMYFVNDNGDYHFDVKKLSEAHRWCQLQCELSLSQGESLVVSNTFIKQWEMDAYRLLANKYRAQLSIITCIRQFQNKHNIPHSTLLKMKREWQA